MDTLTQVTPENEDFRDKLVGEGRKYKDDNALAKAYINADLHIRELQDKLDDRDAQTHLMNEVLTRLRGRTADNQDEEEVTPGTEPAAKRPDVRPENVAEVVKQVVAQEKLADVAKANTAKAFELIMAHFDGNKDEAAKAVNAAWKGKKELKEVLDRLAATDPESAVKFVLGATVANPNPPQNAPGLDKGSSPEPVFNASTLTWKQAQEVRKKDPRKYKSLEFRQALEQAAAKAAAAGKDFYSN